MQLGLMSALTVSFFLVGATVASAFPGVAKRIGRPDLRHDVIYKGSNVAETGKTWHYSVRWYGDSSSCTGVFIAHDVMLTATHCFVGKKPGENKNRGDLAITLFRGSESAEHKFAGRGDYVVYTNPSYDITNTYTRSAHDLAVVVFRKEETLPYSRDTAELLTSTYARTVEIGDDAVMVGAGGSGFEKGSGTLRFAFGRISEHPMNGAITITGNNGSGICFGDSGGPVFYRSSRFPGRLFLMGILADFVMYLDDRNGDGCTPGGTYSWLTANSWNWVEAKMKSGRDHFASARERDREEERQRRLEEERLRQERIQREIEARKPEHVKLAEEAEQAQRQAEALAAEATKLQEQANAKAEAARKASEAAARKAEAARKALEAFTAQQPQPKVAVPAPQ